MKPKPGQLSISNRFTAELTGQRHAGTEYVLMVTCTESKHSKPLCYFNGDFPKTILKHFLSREELPGYTFSIEELQDMFIEESGDALENRK